MSATDWLLPADIVMADGRSTQFAAVQLQRGRMMAADAKGSK
jgi:hypothetical protein